MTVYYFYSLFLVLEISGRETAKMNVDYEYKKRKIIK